jgi:hypothetical protein
MNGDFCHLSYKGVFIEVSLTETLKGEVAPISNIALGPGSFSKIKYTTMAVLRRYRARQDLTDEIYYGIRTRA